MSTPSRPPSTSTHAAAVALSDHLDTRTAAMEIAERVQADLNGSCDLAVMFGSFHHCAAFADAASILRTTINPRVLLGCTGESVLGEDRELDGRSGLTAIAFRMPGVDLHIWDHTPDRPMPVNDAQATAQHIGASADHRVTMILADPFTTRTKEMMYAINDCRGAGRSVPIVGGLASAARHPGRNVLILNETARPAGAVGVTISGNVEVDFIVSQGCRPIGKPFVITKAKDNAILELGGRRAIDVIQETVSELPEQDKQLLSGGLLLGVVINEQKTRFGRGDFLVRNILGVNQQVGGILAGDKFKMGRTVQLHVRDAKTASEDLSLLLDAQQFGEKPFGGLLFSCNGRGARLFGQPGHDLNLFHKRLGDVPIAGFFAGGEIGPVGNRSYMHSHTASAALFRPRGST